MKPQEYAASAWKWPPSQIAPKLPWQAMRRARVIVGAGMTLAAPGATGFVVLAQRAVINKRLSPESSMRLSPVGERERQRDRSGHRCRSVIREPAR